MNIQILNDILSLTKNWNGYGAEPFSEKHVDFVSDLIDRMPCRPDVFPTGRKSIQLEFYNENAYLEFEIFENEKIHLYIQHSDGLEQEGIIQKEYVNDIIEEFFRV